MSAPRRRPPPRSVESLIAYYWLPGEVGYKRALAEARELLAVGAPLSEACEAVGWSPVFLRAAIERAERDEDRLRHETDAA